MLFSHKIFSTVISYERCEEIRIPPYINNECRQFEFIDTIDYQERWNDEWYYVYRNLLVNYDFRNTNYTIQFPEVSYDEKLKKDQKVVLVYNELNHKIYIRGAANDFVIIKKTSIEEH